MTWFPQVDSSRTTDATEHLRATATLKLRTVSEDKEVLNKLRQRMKTLQCQPRRNSFQDEANGKMERPRPQLKPIPSMQVELATKGNGETRIPQKDRARMNGLLNRFTRMYEPKNCSLSTSQKILERRYAGGIPLGKLINPTARDNEAAFYQTVYERQQQQLNHKRRLLNSIEREQRKRVKIIFTKKRLSKMRGQLQINLQKFVTEQ